MPEEGSPAVPYHRVGARRSLLFTVGFRSVAQLFTILGYIVMVRGMAEHDFGILQLLYAIVPAMSAVASLGLEQTLRRFQPEYLAAGDRSAAAWLFRLVSSLRLGVNIVAIAVTLLAWNLIAPIVQLEAYRQEFLLFGAIILLHFQSGILTLSLSAHMLHQFSVGMTTVLAVAKLAAYLAFSHFDSLTLTNAIIADTIAYACFFCGLWLAHRHHCASASSAGEKHHLSPTERGRLFKYSLYNNFNDAGVLMLSSQGDSLFIAALLNPVAVGAYAFGTRLNQMAGRLMPTAMFQNVIQPLFFSIPKEAARSRLPKYFSFLIDIALLMRVPMATFVLVYHSEIVAVLFGGKFLEFSPLLPVLFAFGVLNSIADPVTLVAQYAEKAWVILLSKIFVVFNITAMLLLIPMLGVYGAAIASGTAQLLKNGFIWWHVRDSARWQDATSVLLATIGIWASYASLAAGLKAITELPQWADLASGAVLGAGAALLYVRSAALTRQDRDTLGAILVGRESGFLRLLRILPARAQ